MEVHEIPMKGGGRWGDRALKEILKVESVR